MKCTAVSGEKFQSDLGSGTVKRNVIDFLVSSDDVTNMFADVFPTTPTCGWLTADHYMCIGHSGGIVSRARERSFLRVSA